jgi:hypothetical protein
LRIDGKRVPSGENEVQVNSRSAVRSIRGIRNLIGQHDGVQIELAFFCEAWHSFPIFAFTAIRKPSSVPKKIVGGALRVHHQGRGVRPSGPFLPGGTNRPNASRRSTPRPVTSPLSREYPEKRK